MPSWIKLTLGLLLALLLIVVGAGAVAPMLIDKQQLLRDLEAEISLALGRPTQVESIGLLRLLPTPLLRLQGVRVSEIAAADAPMLATVEAVELEAAIWPLAMGRLVLAEVLIDRPKLTLSSVPPAPSAAVRLLRLGGERYRSVLVGQHHQALASVTGGDSAAGAAGALPPIRRLMIRDGELIGAAATTGTGSMVGLSALNVTAGPIAPGRIGRLEATFRLFTLARGAETTGTAAAATNRVGSDSLGTGTASTYAPSFDLARFSLPGLVEAEIKLADPLTEIELRPLRLRFGSPAGAGQGQPIEVDAEALIDLNTARLSIDPFDLTADKLRITGAAQLFPTPLGLGIDGQVRVPPFDLRTWLVERAALTMPGNAITLRRVGGQFDLQLRGSALAIENAALSIDQTQLTAVARLRLPQAPSTLFAGRLALAIDRLDLGPYLAAAEPMSATATPPVTSTKAAPTVLPPLPPLPTVVTEKQLPHLPGRRRAMNVSPTEQGLRVQLAAGELRLGGLGFSSVQLAGHLLQDSLEFNLNADFYGGQLEAQFAASQLVAIVQATQPEGEPDLPPADQEVSPGPGPGQGRALEAQLVGARGLGPDLRFDATASGVDLAALLSELPGGGHNQTPITGLAEIDLDLFAQGADPASIISTLGGEAAFAVRDGAVTMVDFGQLITGTIGAIGVSPEDAENLTRFHALTLTAKGSEGQFSSDDIQLRSNLLNIDGRGELDLTTEQIALNLRAVMTKPPKGQGRGIKELEGVPIPISAAGPWSDPRWEVDVRRALDTAARRALREDSGLFDEIEERTGIKGLGDGLRHILPGLLGR